MNKSFRLVRLGALLILAAAFHTVLQAQYDPGSRDPEASSDSDSQSRAAAKLKAAIGQKAPDFSFQGSDGKSYRVSEFSGRWLLLQFGGSWCPPSEATAKYFSCIRKNLEGKPFEFVEIYDDASLDDALLNSLTDFHGLRGFAGTSGSPDFYEVGYIPVWYLIDPQGVIRLDGHYMDPQALREAIGKILQTDTRFSGVSLTPSPQDQRYLDAVTLSQDRKWKEAATAWEEILKEDPTNPYAIARYARCLAWTKGYKDACKGLEERIKFLPKGAPDFLIFFFAGYKLNIPSRQIEGITDMGSLKALHPGSKYLEAILQVFSKTPDELSREELHSLENVYHNFREAGIGYFYQFALECHGLIEKAIENFGDQPKLSGRDAYALAGFLHRFELDDQAKTLLFVQNPPTPENSNKAMAWELAMSAALLEKWDLSAAYAQRYEQHQPTRGEGPLYQMLAAMRQSQTEKAKEIRPRLEQILAANYKSVPLIQGEGPTRDQLMAIGDENARMVTALSAYLFAQMDGQTDKATKIRRNSLTSFPANTFNYALIYSITTPRSEEDFKAQARLAEKKQQRKTIKETLDAEDAKLSTALGISTNNPPEVDKVGAYFLGKLSPVYEGLRTNEFFPEMEKYRQQLEATFALAAGLNKLDQLPGYCTSNNISHDDITAFINGNVINDLAYATTSVSEEARRQYIALAESCITNGPVTFFSGTYKNWDSFNSFLSKRNTFLKERSERNPQTLSSPTPSPSPSTSPAPSTAHP